MRSAECEMRNQIFQTPLGWAGVAVSGQGITRIVLPKKNKKAVERELISAECGLRSAERKATTKLSSLQILTRSIQLLQAYSSGKTVAFDLPLDISSYTPFQQAVWQAAAMIPYGETRSYGWIAKKIRRPLASRAVGQAMGANPVPILVP